MLPEFPAVEFDITCDLSAQLMAQVQRAEIDLALVTLAARPSLALAVREVARFGLVAVDMDAALSMAEAA